MHKYSTPPISSKQVDLLSMLCLGYGEEILNEKSHSPYRHHSVR